MGLVLLWPFVFAFETFFILVSFLFICVFIFFLFFFLFISTDLHLWRHRERVLAHFSRLGCRRSGLHLK